MNLRKKVCFGKIDLYNTGKCYPAEVVIELRERGGEPTFTIENGEKIPTGETTPIYYEFSACGTVWNTRKTDCILGGQCLDDMSKYIKTAEFSKIYKWWKLYHLNSMNAGTPEQTKAVKEWEAQGNKYDYTAVCEMLKTKGLFEIPFTGKTIGKEYNGELYKYGHGWVINDIPENDLEEIKTYLQEA